MRNLRNLTTKLLSIIRRIFIEKEHFCSFYFKAHFYMLEVIHFCIYYCRTPQYDNVDFRGRFQFSFYQIFSFKLIFYYVKHFHHWRARKLKIQNKQFPQKMFWNYISFQKKKLIKKSSHLLLVSVFAQFFILPNEYEPCVSLLSYRSAVSICHGLKMFVGEHPFSFRFLFGPYFFKCPIKCNFTFKI